MIIDRDILPIFIFKKGQPAIPISMQGTGFVIASNLLITCWHCVSTPLLPNEQYGVAIKPPNENNYRTLFLTNIEQDANSNDLATANLQLEPTFGLCLANNKVAYGTDVFTFGYPLTDVRQASDDSLDFELKGRYLQGYIMRSFYYRDPIFGSVPSYELDFAVPTGLSGAPIIQHHSREVIGVAYGSHDEGTIVQYERKDPVTGKREPEIQKLILFGLAHYTKTLQQVKGRATMNIPLIDFLKSK